MISSVTGSLSLSVLVLGPCRFFRLRPHNSGMTYPKKETATRDVPWKEIIYTHTVCTSCSSLLTLLNPLVRYNPFPIHLHQLSSKKPFLTLLRHYVELSLRA